MAKYSRTSSVDTPISVAKALTNVSDMPPVREPLGGPAGPALLLEALPCAGALAEAVAAAGLGAVDGSGREVLGTGGGDAGDCGAAVGAGREPLPF